MISPTNGRIVWFTPSTTTNNPAFAYADKSQPLAAMIAYVHSDRMVNLTVSDQNGVPYSFTSVTLLQDDVAKPESGFYCEWMPFQKGQAAKAEAPAIDVEALTQKILDRVKADAPAAPEQPSILHSIEDLVERAAQKVHDKMAGVS